MVVAVREKDHTSLSNPQDVIVTHLDWNIEVDFDRRVVSGTATYDIQVLATNGGSAAMLYLDTSHLNITSVTNTQSGEALPFVLQSWIPNKHHLGQKLEITLPSLMTGDDTSKIDNKTKITIQYSTTDQSSALQWLPPAQTAGKKYPYLFTQCQAIHARTLVPCQDTPGVKFTYNANVTVPSWATAVLSAVMINKDDSAATKTTNNNTTIPIASTTTSSNNATSPTTSDDPSSFSSTNNKRTWSFVQKVPIPSYLLAMAVGELDRHVISDRCAIWTEPSLIKAAAYEFHQTEDFLQIAEDIAGLPYVWGRYDLLLLPPSFPYGGMENPCLTFVTPTLLAGDRSLADVVAHEICHSWTGNLVTNATWDHFWLNEGWTTWFQRMITTRIYNNNYKSNDDNNNNNASDATTLPTSSSSSSFRDMDALGGYKHLEDAVKHMSPNYTTVVLEMGDNDPDEFYSIVAYEKGYNLLHALEQKVGSDAFIQFFQAYIKEFAYKTLTSRDFQKFCQTQFSNDLLKDFDWDTWLYKPGMPPTEPKFDRTLTKEAEDLAQRWVSWDRQQANAIPPPPIDDDDDVEFSKPKQWSSQQMICFLDNLETLTTTTSSSKPLTVSTLSQLNQRYGLGKSQNAEILFRYCRLAVASKDDSILPIVTHFITSQGRMKYVRPLYRALFHSQMGHDIAISTFIQHQDMYHPICAKMIAHDLQQDQKGVHDDKKGVTQYWNMDRNRGWLMVAGVGAAVAILAVSMMRRFKR